MKNFQDKTRLGTIEMKNRFIRAAVGDTTDNGHLTEQIYNLYGKLADGGAAALITGFTVVDAAENVANIFSLAEDKFIPEYKRLTDRIHEAGTKAIVQLVYLSGLAPVERPLSPCNSRNAYTGIDTFEMTQEEIQGMVGKFADAARRAKEAGFDGVEIHGAHGFLHHQFFSPVYNHRTDEYGGNRENRCRFIMETYEAIRAAVGSDFTILAKISTEDGAVGGVTEDDYLYLSAELSNRGIDGIETSGAWMGHKPKERMFYADAARKIAETVSCKVIQTGGNRDFEPMLEALNATGVEYFGMARPFISEPDWVNRYFDGTLGKMRCISCNGCTRNGGLSCILDKKNKS